MTTPVGSDGLSALIQFQEVTEVTIGTIATAVALLIHPITGTAIGTYFITYIATNALLDKMGISNTHLLIRVTKVALATIVAFLADFALLTLLGVAITVTPIVVGVIIGAIAFQVLSAIAIHRWHGILI